MRTYPPCWVFKALVILTVKNDVEENQLRADYESRSSHIVCFGTWQKLDKGPRLSCLNTKIKSLKNSLLSRNAHDISFCNKGTFDAVNTMALCLVSQFSCSMKISQVHTLCTDLLTYKSFQCMSVMAYLLITMQERYLLIHINQTLKLCGSDMFMVMFTPLGANLISFCFYCILYV